MSEVVERVTAAIVAERLDLGGQELGLSRAAAERLARVAIAAMREPSEAMIGAGDEAWTGASLEEGYAGPRDIVELSFSAISTRP